MGRFIFDTLEMLFNGGFIEDVSDFISKVLEGLETVMSDANISMTIDIFIGIAASMLIIFLFADLFDKASKDMLTFEKLIVTFIKMLVACMIVICLKEIITGLFTFAMSLYDWLEVSSFKGLAEMKIEYFPDQNSNPSKWPAYEDEVKKAFEDRFGKKTAIVTELSMFMKMLIPTFLLWISRIAAFFIAASNAVIVIVRALFAPIGVVQLFDEGQKSAGIKYLKKFLAEGLTFVVILGILYASAKLQNALLANVIADDPFNGKLLFSKLNDICSISTMTTVCIIQLASVGAMFKSNQLANDIVGV